MTFNKASVLLMAVVKSIFDLILQHFLTSEISFDELSPLEKTEDQDFVFHRMSLCLRCLKI